MENKDIEDFAYAAMNVILQDILIIDIVKPRLIFDYSINPNINSGYYMYQNVSGTIITLNMNSICTLKTNDDIKTVITYGFIHEIIHMCQSIYSKYKTDAQYYSYIEDNADYFTIQFIRKNILLINKTLNFKFNDTFLIGIERQLKHSFNYNNFSLDKHVYISKTIAGVLSGKLNYNFDYLFNLMINANTLQIIFPNKRKYYIDLDYEHENSIDTIVNLLCLADYKMIHINFIDRIESYKVKELTLTLY